MSAFDLRVENNRLVTYDNDGQVYYAESVMRADASIFVNFVSFYDASNPFCWQALAIDELDGRSYFIDDELGGVDEGDIVGEELLVKYTSYDAARLILESLELVDAFAVEFAAIYFASLANLYILENNERLSKLVAIA